ncbi:MAG TPA: hypothetical protein VIQ99_08895 [Gammaproteobacteria bacterium]
MDANLKNNDRRGRRLLNGVMSDWVWEVCLILIATPIVIDAFLSIGANYTA